VRKDWRAAEQGQAAVWSYPHMSKSLRQSGRSEATLRGEPKPQGTG